MMNTPSALPKFDYNHMAGEFDRFLPQVHPVALAVLDRLPALAGGATVLDVACGTGEPGLTLARRTPEVQVLGVDNAAGMIAVAQGKAAREALRNVRFEVMANETLALPDASVDVVISRFGLMMFGDVPASARELARVLRVDGHFSLAVWDAAAKNTLMSAVQQQLRSHLPQEQSSPMDRLNEWAAEGLRTRLLQEAGLRQVHSEMFSWNYQFTGFAEAWDLVSRMGHFTGHAALTPDVQQQIKQELEAALSPYQQPGGEYLIPHACRLLWGQR